MSKIYFFPQPALSDLLPALGPYRRIKRVNMQEEKRAKRKSWESEKEEVGHNKAKRSQQATRPKYKTRNRGRSHSMLLPVAPDTVQVRAGRDPEKQRKPSQDEIYCLRDWTGRIAQLTIPSLEEAFLPQERLRLRKTREIEEDDRVCNSLTTSLPSFSLAFQHELPPSSLPSILF